MKMKIGICFFMESNLGGAATQADDLVTSALKLGHEACLLRFVSSPRARNLFDYKSSLPDHTLNISRTGIRFQGPRILLNRSTLKNVLKYLNTFDLLVFVGGCPHITRTFSSEDFYEVYEPIYSRTKCKKVMFFTDPFWQKLYPFAKDIIDKIDINYAFAEAYKRRVVDSELAEDVRVCNFGSIAACKKKDSNSSKRRNKRIVVWPHQWRSWKNPDVFVELVPKLKVKSVGYSDGIEYHKIRRDRWASWEEAVRYDYLKEERLNPEGNLTMYGTVPQEELLDVFSSCQWMIDLTGMSGRTGKPLDKFVGNYQCVNIECMMLGCVTFKYENTIEPYSQIPRDCVIPLPLITEPKELATYINKHLSQREYHRVATRALGWSKKFDPIRVFNNCFVKPFKREV